MKYSSATVWQNFQLLIDEKKIDAKFANQTNSIDGRARLTALGYKEFDPWYTKVWRFFTNDMSKILSVVATFLSIVATIISFTKNYK